MATHHVYFTGPTGIADRLTVTADTVEGIQEAAHGAVKRMDGTYLWSEEVQEPSDYVKGLRVIDTIPQEFRFFARILLTVQDGLRGYDNPKPFLDWTLDDIIDASKGRK